MAAGMYMASLGGTGIRQLARLNYDKTQYLKETLRKAGAKVVFDGPVFNEFVVEFPTDFQPAHERLLAKNIVAGLELGALYPEMGGRYLFCVTETISKQTMDTIAAEVGA
jgi:glycine dehydrogenase subunit 1